MLSKRCEVDNIGVMCIKCRTYCTKCANVEVILSWCTAAMLSGIDATNCAKCRVIELQQYSTQVCVCVFNFHSALLKSMFKINFTRLSPKFSYSVTSRSACRQYPRFHFQLERSMKLPGSSFLLQSYVS